MPARSQEQFKPASRRFDSPQQEAFLNLWRTYDRLRMLEDDLFARHGLTAQQYNAMRLLRAAHPDSLATLTLASRLVSRAPDITRLLDRLEERSLVRRERPDDNRRTVRVAITAEGLALLERLTGQIRDCHNRQLGHLSENDLSKFIDLLRRARAPHESENGHWR